MIKNKISTTAEYMICPPQLSNENDGNFEILGYNTFLGYPFIQNSSKYVGDSNPNNFEKELVNAVHECIQLQDRSQIVLLLSDGKDSLALAVALRELGISAMTVTFLRRDDYDLKKYILSVCDKLGHEPFFYFVDDVLSNFSHNDYLSIVKSSETLVMDQAALFFAFGLKKFFLENIKDPEDTLILDGLGNDEYFGYIPSKHQYYAHRLSKILPTELLAKISPNLRWFFRNTFEAHGDMSALAAFFRFGQSNELKQFFDKVPRHGAFETIMDFRAFCRGSYHDHQCMMGKTRTIARHLNAEVAFPWTQGNLPNYCFNLPVINKYDSSLLKNKILLRTFLEEKIGWERNKRGVDLFLDLDLKVFKNRFLCNVVNLELIDQITNSFLLPNSVKRRAFLELYNLACYIDVNPDFKIDISEILYV